MSEKKDFWSTLQDAVSGVINYSNQTFHNLEGGNLGLTHQGISWTADAQAHEDTRDVRASSKTMLYVMFALLAIVGIIIALYYWFAK